MSLLLLRSGFGVGIESRLSANMVGLFISSCCFVQWSQNGGLLNITEIYSVTGVDDRTLKSASLGHCQGMVRALLPLDTLGEHLLSASSNFCGRWHSLAYGGIPPVHASFFMSPPLLNVPLLMTLVVGFRTHPDKSRIISPSQGS